MNARAWSGSNSVFAGLLCAGLTVVGAQQAPPVPPAAGRAGTQATPPAPTGPLAAAKYRDIQVMKDVPADQFDITMDYFVAATGLQCQGCHVRDEATGEFDYANDHRIKSVTRKMINLVRTVNAGDYGGRTNCAQCHAGRPNPPGLPLAQPMTPDQIAALAAQTAARQGGPGGASPAAAGTAGAQGAGQQIPAPAIDDVINKYVEALGGRAALEKLQSRAMSGTLTNRAAQSMAFAIEEKGTKYLETTQSQPTPTTIGFDGASGWTQSGTRVADLVGFPLQRALCSATLTLPLRLKDKYPNLQAGRPTRLPGASAASPALEVNQLQGASSPYVNEQFYFHATSGLLVRRRVVTRAADRGSMVEQFDYSDYRAVAGVKMPFTIKRTSWNAVDTLTIADIKPNVQIDDAKFARPKR
jgi:hypothetical protein